MTWTTPRTWTTDEVPSAATLNTHIRDNFGEVWRRVSYVTGTSSVSFNATTAATANTIVTAAAFTADGSSPLFVEFFAPSVDYVTANVVSFELYDGASSIGMLGDTSSGATGKFPIHLVGPELTPSAGSHTYSVRAWTPGAGPLSVYAGAGAAAGTRMPLWIKVWSAGASV